MSTLNTSWLVTPVGDHATFGSLMSTALGIVGQPQVTQATVDTAGTFASAYHFEPPPQQWDVDIWAGYVPGFIAAMRPHFNAAADRLLAQSPRPLDLKEQELSGVYYPDMVRAGFLSYDAAVRIVVALESSSFGEHHRVMTDQIRFLRSLGQRSGIDSFIWSIAAFFGLRVFSDHIIDLPGWSIALITFGAGVAGFVRAHSNNERSMMGMDIASDCMSIAKGLFSTSGIYRELKVARDAFDAQDGGKHADST